MSKPKKKTKRRSPADAAAQAAALAERDAKRRAAKKESRKRRLRRAGIITGVAAAVCAAGFGGWYFLKNSSYMQHKRIAVESRHYQVSQAVLGCYFEECRESYDAYAAQSEDIERYDPDISLKKQQYTTGETWYDMLMEVTLNNVTSILQMCESAYDAGYTMPDSEQAKIDEDTDAIDLSRCPKGTTRADAEEAVRLRHIATCYKQSATDAITVTDDEISDYFERNRKSYVEWEMLCSVLSYKGPETDAEDPTLRNAAKANADQLMAMHTADEFRALAKTFLTEDQTEDSLTHSGTGNSYPDSIREWVLADEPPKVGDCYLIDNTDSQQYQVWQLVTEPARDESDTVDLRVCVLTSGSYGSVKAAEAEAQGLMEQCTANGGTWEDFGDIAAAYSEDAQTYPDGGALKGFSEKRSAYGDKLTQWAFDPARQPGDMTVCTENEYVVLGFFEADNPRCAWEYYVYNALYSGKLTDLENNASGHSVAIDDKLIDLPL